MKRLATIFTDADYVLETQGLDAATDYMLNQAKKLDIDPYEFLVMYCDFKGVQFIGGNN